MPRPHRLPGAALDLVEVYLGEFTQAGFLAVSSAEDGARGLLRAVRLDRRLGGRAAERAGRRR